MRKLAVHGARATGDRTRRALLNLSLPGSRELARELACGLHLTSADAGAPDAASSLRPRTLAGSSHDAVPLDRAQQFGCDSVALGPVAATPAHPQAEPIGWSGFAWLRESVALPIYALGGVVQDDLVRTREHGEQGVAAIRGFWSTTPAGS